MSTSITYIFFMLIGFNWHILYCMTIEIKSVYQIADRSDVRKGFEWQTPMTKFDPNK